MAYSGHLFNLYIHAIAHVEELPAEYDGRIRTWNSNPWQSWSLGKTDTERTAHISVTSPSTHPNYTLFNRYSKMLYSALSSLH